MEPALIPLSMQRDARGTLVPVEEERDVPFPIRRVYYIYGVPPGTRRGGHAHLTNRQAAIAVRGSCRFFLDDGHRRAEVVLDRADRALLIDILVWHEMADFTEDCLLIMLASERYNEADYIRDYSHFRRMTGDR